MTLSGGFATALIFALLTAGAFQSVAEEPPWPVKHRLLGKDDKKSEDVSGMACTTDKGFPRACLVIDDNLQAAQFVTLDENQLRTGDLLPLIDNKHDGELLELDGEGVAYADGAFYVVGSHGHPRRAAKTLDDAGRAMIKARIAASSQIVRIGLKPSAGVPLKRDDVRDIRRTGKLREIIAAQPLLRRFLDRRLENNGLTIEGVAVIGGRLFAGFRAPTLDNGRAPVLSVALGALFGNRASQPRVFSLPVGNGQGIRDLAPFDGGLLVLAGPSGDEAGAYNVFWWNGSSENLRHLADITKATAASAKHKPEVILPLDQDAAGLRVLILSDGEEEGAPRSIVVPTP